LQLAANMWFEKDDISSLENAFFILRFRRRSVVSFRHFTILTVWPLQDANEVRDADAGTQPLRIPCEA
jgi:hypothetical protein